MKFETKLLIMLITAIIIIVGTSIARAEAISWKFDDTPTIEECISQSDNNYKACEILVKIAKRAIKEDCVYIGTTKDDE